MGIPRLSLISEIFSKSYTSEDPGVSNAEIEFINKLIFMVQFYTSIKVGWEI